MRFVIGIPTYNNESTITDTLRIISNQTIVPDELIVCDKSNDNTPEVVQEFASDTDSFEITLIRQKGDGVADAYNQILNHIENYDIFGTIQTNFEIPGDWVESAIRLHKKYDHIDIINSSQERNKILDPRSPDYFSGRCFTAKKGVLESVNGWDENFLRGEDWDIHIRLAQRGTQSLGSDALAYSELADDPPVSIRKARRKPTSAMFLAKYGYWYFNYHPTHVIGDLIGALAILTLPLIMSYPASILVPIAYVVGYDIVEGGLGGSLVKTPLKKCYLDGYGFLISMLSIVKNNYQWNMEGFD